MRGMKGITQSQVPLDLDNDSPELEAELLKAIDGPFAPYSSEEMRALGERIIGEKRRNDSRCQASGWR